MLIDAAEQDLRAALLLSQAPGIRDGVVGFHFQQCVEKALKAVLAHEGVAFRRTHDIAELLDLMADRRLNSPPHADWLDELNPYAAEARYGLVAPRNLDRAFAGSAAKTVFEWASAQMGQPPRRVG
ncbi:MAG: HEPN domain-containing protein [Betaproteobacteria bacterium]|nr:HEPN domain-containing protein [Betaproteobacteria bacterium]